MKQANVTFTFISLLFVKYLNPEKSENRIR